LGLTIETRPVVGITALVSIVGDSVAVEVDQVVATFALVASVADTVVVTVFLVGVRDIWAIVLAVLGLTAAAGTLAAVHIFFADCVAVTVLIGVIFGIEGTDIADIAYAVTVRIELIRVWIVRTVVLAVLSLTVGTGSFLAFVADTDAVANAVFVGIVVRVEGTDVARVTDAILVCVFLVGIDLVRTVVSAVDCLTASAGRLATAVGIHLAWITAETVTILVVVQAVWARVADITQPIAIAVDLVWIGCVGAVVEAILELVLAACWVAGAAQVVDALFFTAYAVAIDVVERIVGTDIAAVSQSVAVDIAGVDVVVRIVGTSVAYVTDSVAVCVGLVTILDATVVCTGLRVAIGTNRLTWAVGFV